MQTKHAYAAEILARAHTVMRLLHKKGCAPLRGIRCGYDISPDSQKRANAAELARKDVEQTPTSFYSCAWGLLWALSGADPQMSLTATGLSLGFSERAVGAILWRNDVAKDSWLELSGALRRYRRMTDREILLDCIEHTERIGLPWAKAGAFVKYANMIVKAEQAQFAEKLAHIPKYAPVDLSGDEELKDWNGKPLPPVEAPSKTKAAVEKLKATVFGAKAVEVA
jgi:hypothetical protein